MSLTIIIALIGCITGCCSLTISLYRLWAERYCLKIDTISSECLFFDAVTERKYSSDMQAIIHLTIRNKSVNPVTIHDSYLIAENHFTRFEIYTDSADIRLLRNNAVLPEHLIKPKSYTVIPIDRQLELPVRLQAYDSVECIGFIPYFPCKKDTDTVECNLVLKTAKNPKHEFKVVLHKFSD